MVCCCCCCCCAVSLISPQKPATSKRPASNVQCPISPNLTISTFSNIHIPQCFVWPVIKRAESTQGVYGMNSLERLCRRAGLGWAVKRSQPTKHPRSHFSHWLCQCRGLLQAETPPSSPSSHAPCRTSSFPSTHTRPRLMFERWRLRNGRLVGFCTHLHSTDRCLSRGYLLLFYFRNHRRYD